MDLPNDEVGCDFCTHDSLDRGRVIYVCDWCGADCCSECSDDAPGNKLVCKACESERSLLAAREEEGA